MLHFSNQKQILYPWMMVQVLIINNFKIEVKPCLKINAFTKQGRSNLNCTMMVNFDRQAHQEKSLREIKETQVKKCH
jgi:hypothetical protein